MKRKSIYIILVAFAVFTAFEDCNKSRDATKALTGVDTVVSVVDTVTTGVDTVTTVVDTVPHKDLTKIFVGTYNGYSIRTFKHPSFFADTIPVASIVISQIDSSTMRIQYYHDTTFLFESIDTAFADNSIRSLGTDPIEKITDNGKLTGDSIYYASYRQDMVTFTFVLYTFSGRR